MSESPPADPGSPMADDTTPAVIPDAESADLAEISQSVETSEPVETSVPEEASAEETSDEISKTTETSGGAETAEPSETVAESSESVETLETVETSEPIETSEVAENSEPAETSEPGASSSEPAKEPDPDPMEASDTTIVPSSDQSVSETTAPQVDTSQPSEPVEPSQPSDPISEGDPSEPTPSTTSPTSSLQPVVSAMESSETPAVSAMESSENPAETAMESSENPAVSAMESSAVAAVESSENPAVAAVESSESPAAVSVASTSAAAAPRLIPPPQQTLDEEGLACIDELDSDLPDEIDCTKVLIRGLPEAATDDTLKTHFKKYGEVRVAKIRRDEEGKSKCFGVVLFEDTSNIAKALEEPTQQLDGTEIRLSKAMPSYNKMRTNKLFVGGLPAALTEDQLRAYFEGFGKIQSFQFILNKMTNTRKAFCFIIFEGEEAVELITEGKIPPNSVVHTIEGHTVDCKKKFEEDHPVQKKIKARSSQYSSSRSYGSTSNNTYGHPAATGYEAYSGYPATAYAYPPGYEQYYGAYAAAAGYGYPGYAYPGYPGYTYPGYTYPQAYTTSAYGPMKQNRNGANYRPY